MTDTFTKQKRSEIMSLIRSKDTKPEIIVRKWLHRQGYRFCLHSKKLTGKPDITLPKHKTAIFVNGCFWHRHNGCKKATVPASNAEVWARKFEETVSRDKKHVNSLTEAGWRVVVVWECEVASGRFISKLDELLSIKM